MAEQKSEKPTKRRIDRARKDGTTLKSTLVAQGLAGFACFFGVIALVRLSWVRYVNLLEYCMMHGFIAPGAALRMALQVMLELSLAGLVPMVVVFVLVIGLQQGVVWEPAILSPKGTRFGGGLKRIGGGLKGLWQQLLRAGALSAVFYWLAVARGREVVGAILLQPEEQAHYLWGVLEHWAAIGLGIILVLGGLDYVVQRRKFFKDLSMSLDEVRREHREDEGDPHIKGHRRAQHLELSRQEQITRIRRARVVVVERA